MYHETTDAHNLLRGLLGRKYEDKPIEDEAPRQLSFEGKNLFTQNLEQIEALKNYIRDAEEKLQEDMNSVARDDVYEQAMSRGVIDESYRTVRYGRVSKYSGSALIDINGRYYSAIGHGPKGTAEWIDKEGTIEFIPQELPNGIDKDTLSPEQIELFKMSKQQLDSISRKVALAEKTLTHSFDQFEPEELVKLALLHGINDASYSTVRHGRVAKYSGSAQIVINGERYEAKGHGPKGDAYGIDSDGYISWNLLSTSNQTEE